MEIARDDYLKIMIEKRGNGLIKIITGVRRCGKSYLMNTIFRDYLLSSGVSEDHIVNFAFDSATDLAKIGEDMIDMRKKRRGADPEKFIRYISSKLVDDGRYYLLLDEVQELDCFESVLNGYLRDPRLDVYVSGSNAKFLVKDVVTEFSGRGDEIRIHPCTFREFYNLKGGDRYASLAEYMRYGGIPMVILERNESFKERTLTNLFEEIYLRDIVARHKIKNQSELSSLFDLLASSIGCLTNPKKLASTFKSKMSSKITSATIDKYIGYFADSFLIEGAVRYDIKGKKYIDTPKKYYFEDLGLRNARLEYRQLEMPHLFENLIYNELRARGYKVDIGVTPIMEANKTGTLSKKYLEIDFLARKRGKKYYIQSAYSLPTEDKLAQEKRPLSLIKDSFKKIIITNDFMISNYDESGILTLNIFDFLLSDDALDR